MEFIAFFFCIRISHRRAGGAAEATPAPSTTSHNKRICVAVCVRAHISCLLAAINKIAYVDGIVATMFSIRKHKMKIHFISPIWCIPSTLTWLSLLFYALWIHSLVRRRNTLNAIHIGINRVIRYEWQKRETSFRHSKILMLIKRRRRLRSELVRGCDARQHTDFLVLNGATAATLRINKTKREINSSIEAAHLSAACSAPSSFIENSRIEF